MDNWLRALLALIVLAIISFSLAGNVLVIVAITMYKKLRKPENFFLVSLSVSDVLVASIVMTFAGVNDIFPEWRFGRFCSVWVSSDVMCCTASILNLCAISFDRYWHIRHPLRYCLTMTKYKIAVIIGLIWFISATISFVPIHLNLSGYAAKEAIGNLTSNFGQDMCMLNFTLPYTALSSSISFFLPCTVMVITYWKLYYTARSHLSLLQSQFVCLESAILVGSRLPGLDAFRRESQLQIKTAYRKRRKKPKIRLNPQTISQTNEKAKRTIGIIMGVFLACWLPFFVINVVRAACSCIPFSVFQTVTWIGYCNSMANPLIYGIFSRDFRHAFKKILSCRKRTAPMRCSFASCKKDNTVVFTNQMLLKKKPVEDNSQIQPQPL